MADDLKRRRQSVGVDSNRGPPTLQPLGSPTFDVYVADRAHGFDLDATLPRGRLIVLPVLDSIEDVPFDIERFVGRRRTLLFFYPGSWSGSARRILALIARHTPDFAALSAAVVAVTPEQPARVMAPPTSAPADFAIAIDHACRFSKSLGIAFKLPLQVRRIVRDEGVRIKVWNGEGSYDLPMPAAVILDRARRVRWSMLAGIAEDVSLELCLGALAQLPEAE